MGNLVTLVLSVFTSIGDWFVETMLSLASLFVSTGTGGEIELTLFGIMALMGVGVGTILLIINKVSDFMAWKR